MFVGGCRGCKGGCVCFVGIGGGCNYENGDGGGKWIVMMDNNSGNGRKGAGSGGYFGDGGGGGGCHFGSGGGDVRIVFYGFGT